MVKLHSVIGPDNGPALVLIPGQGANWESYAKVLIPPWRRFQVVALDIRGHGRSDRTTGSYSFSAIGEDPRAFLKGVVKRPALVSGNSSGGLVAIWLAANAPDWVRAIIAKDAPFFSAEWPRIQQEYVFQILTLTVEILSCHPPACPGDLFRSLGAWPKPTGMGGLDEPGHDRLSHYTLRVMQ